MKKGCGDEARGCGNKGMFNTLIISAGFFQGQHRGPIARKSECFLRKESIRPGVAITGYSVI